MNASCGCRQKKRPAAFKLRTYTTSLEKAPTYNDLQYYIVILSYTGLIYSYCPTNLSRLCSVITLNCCLVFLLDICCWILLRRPSFHLNSFSSAWHCFCFEIPFDKALHLLIYPIFLLDVTIITPELSINAAYLQALPVLLYQRVLDVTIQLTLISSDKRATKRGI